MKDVKVKVLKNEPMTKNIYKLQLEVPVMPEIKGGQFVMLEVPGDAMLLRRPLGICSYDNSSITVCYQIAGAGTHSLASVAKGSVLKALFPLGNGFPAAGENIALVGGGVGLFPLLSVAMQNADKKITSCLGFRNIDCVCLVDEFSEYGKVRLMTNDGCCGDKGCALTGLKKEMKEQSFDTIFACGPMPMFKALKEYLIEQKSTAKCYVSLEERMGCGIGACLVCTCKVESGGRKSVCKDGPVFDIMEVEL